MSVLNIFSLKQPKLINMKSPVLAMCQVGIQIWLMLKHGTLIAISTSSFQIEYHITKTELARDDLVRMMTINDDAKLIAMAYKDGSVALISCIKFEESDTKAQTFGHNILNAVKSKLRDIKLSIVNVASSQLYAIEVCKPQDGDQVEVWCGCDNSFIKIFIPHNGSSQLQLKTVLNTHISSADILQDASIIQLKSSFNAEAHMYALHSCGGVISCWNVCEQPVLNTVIKLTQLSSPGN